MNAELDALLKLERNPFFKLNKKQEARLAELKAAQKKVATPKKKRVIPKGFQENSEMGVNGNPIIEPKQNKSSRKKKTTNEVKPEEKETGELEIASTED